MHPTTCATRAGISSAPGRRSDLLSLSLYGAVYACPLNDPPSLSKSPAQAGGRRWPGGYALFRAGWYSGRVGLSPKCIRTRLQIAIFRWPLAFPSNETFAQSKNQRSSSTMSKNFDKGWSLCFGENRDLELGREYFRESVRDGNIAAIYYLGLSYEEEGAFDEAESYYLQGLEKKYVLAIFRLALLHKNARVCNPDRDFYLTTIKRLATDKHWASVGLYTRERIKGSYGFVGMLGGMLAFAPNFLRVLLASLKDPNADSARLRRR